MEESRSRLYGHAPAGCPKRRGAPKKLSPFAPGILHFQSVAGFCAGRAEVGGTRWETAKALRCPSKDSHRSWWRAFYNEGSG